MPNLNLEIIQGILRQQYALYPLMEVTDYIKLLYQNEFGGGHMISNEEAALRRLEAEWAQTPANADQPLFENIGNDIWRLNLAAAKATAIRPTTVNKLFVLGANLPQGNVSSFEQKLAAFRQWCADGLFAACPQEVESYLHAYKQAGYPAVSHSEAYRGAYQPAYRLIKGEHKRYFELFMSIDRLSKQDSMVNVAIDGNSASGKSSLAALLATIYDCNVIHMDDFFLPFPMRTPERLAEVGGNIDYERFSKQVVTGLTSGVAFSYGVFDCSVGKLVAEQTLPAKKLNIVEGVYSLHPRFIDLYTLKVFLKLDADTQSQRILARNGPLMHQRFLNEWIPLEDYYFKEAKVAAQADLVFNC